MKRFFLPTLWPSFVSSSLGLVIGLALWSHLPETMAMHFDINGYPGEWVEKSTAVITLPLVSIAISIVVWMIVWWLDQRLISEKHGRNVLSRIFNSISILLLCVQGIILVVALDPSRVPVNQVLFLILGLFFVLFGISLRGLPLNKALGFRFPWNAKDFHIWNRTHDLFYRWFVLVGVLLWFGGLLWPDARVALALIAIALLMPTLLSYKFARQLSRRRGQHHVEHHHRPKPVP